MLGWEFRSNPRGNDTFLITLLLGAARALAERTDIKDARKRNENQIEIDVQRWIKHTTNLIKENNEISQTQFRSCWPYKKYRQGKRLAVRTAIITKEIEKRKKIK